jgi:hypothetical protein
MGMAVSNIHTMHEEEAHDNPVIFYGSENRHP